MAAPKINVLVTGAGAPGGPGVIKALKQDPQLRVHGIDINPHASGSFLCDVFHIGPRATDEQFTPKLLSLCQTHSIAAILPLVTRELSAFAHARESFSAIGVTVVVPPPEMLDIANDKGRLYEHLHASSIALPQYRIVRDVEGLREAARVLGYPRSPVVMKPCLGNGSRGLRILDPTKSRASVLFQEKPNSTFSTLDDVISAIGSASVPELLVSEFLPGEELTIDCLVDHGRVVELLIRARDEIRSGISTAGRFLDQPDIAAYIANIVSTLPGLNGPIGFQVKRSTQGDFRLLECNPRIQGTSVAALGCGVNLPLLALNQALGRRTPQGRRKSNIGFVRYYEELFYEY